MLCSYVGVSKSTEYLNINIFHVLGLSTGTVCDQDYVTLSVIFRFENLILYFLKDDC